MRQKIEIDHTIIGDGSNGAIWYQINARLSSKMQTIVSTFYKLGGPLQAHDPVAFMTYLDQTFGNLKEKEHAQALLRTLKQREHQQFGSFLPTFESTLADAGGGD